MKRFVERLTVLSLFLLTLGFALSQGQVMTAQPNAGTPVFLPYLPNLWPIPTPTPTRVPVSAPIKLGPVGTSTGGDAFEDAVPGTSKVTYLYVHAGLLVDQVQFFLDTGALPAHGTSTGGDLNKLQLIAGEYITEVNGHAGMFVDQIGVKTNLRTWGPWGGTGGDAFALTAPAGYEIVGFWGRSGMFLDNLGVLARVRQ